MTTFQDLIRKGVAQHHTDNIKACTCDCLCGTYNKIWGLASSTHMAKSDAGEIVITGTLCSDNKQFEHFASSSYWKGVDFSSSSCGCYSLYDFLRKNGSSLRKDMKNGDCVYLCEPCPTTEEPQVTDCACPNCLSLFDVHVNEECVAIVLAKDEAEAKKIFLFEHSDLDEDDVEILETNISLYKSGIICDDYKEKD